MIDQFQLQQMQDRLARGRKQPATPVCADAVDCEADLHEQIRMECQRQRWLAFHGRMDKRTARTVGEPDWVILAENRVLFVECKTKTGKLSPEQLGVKLWAERLGHTVHICRSFTDFLTVIGKEL